VEEVGGVGTRRHEGTKGLKKPEYEPLPPRIERLATVVVDAAFQVHNTLGPGLLESVYETCLCHELACRKVPFRRQVSVPVVYRDIRLDSGLRLDLLVDEELVVEIKAVEEHLSLYEAQLLTYLKLVDVRLGLLINFNVELIKHGISRVIR
jgi:GxxExxY protein